MPREGGLSATVGASAREERLRAARPGRNKTKRNDNQLPGDHLQKSYLNRSFSNGVALRSKDFSGRLSWLGGLALLGE
jgi:hypothetical protein